MCLIRTAPYNICCCIRGRAWRSHTCTEDDPYIGRYLMIRQSNLQSCEECWEKGVRGVNKPFAKFSHRLTEEERERQKGKSERYCVKEVLRRCKYFRTTPVQVQEERRTQMGQANRPPKTKPARRKRRNMKMAKRATKPKKPKQPNGLKRKWKQDQMETKPQTKPPVPRKI
jgi:hypothetical protein